MIPSPSQIAFAVVGVAAYLAAAYFADRALAGRARSVFRWIVVGVTVAAYFLVLGGVDAPPLGVRWPGLIQLGLVDRGRAVDITKALIPIVAAGAVFYERHRVLARRPIAERWKRFVGLALAAASLVCYFNAFDFGYPKFYHRWEHYHYYIGAKYFRELGYDGLYKCGVIAQDEIGVLAFNDETDIGAGHGRLDLSREARHPDKKIRNLGGDNLLIPVTDILAHPEVCKSQFAPARWEEYKRDIAFFRVASDRKYWDDMQQDHGYNPPPVWTLGGWFFASLFPAGKVFVLPILGKTLYLQLLAMIDVAYLAGMFAALWWAFGWRVAAVGAIFFGCQAPAAIFWTQGAFLRQDWLFWLVFAACAARKRWFVAAGASLVYAALLRVFPGLAVVGWLVVAGHHLARHKTLTRPMQRTLAGGVLAAAILIPLSVKVAGPIAYQDFYRHTLEIHDRTPLTNHMGLRVLVAQKIPFEIRAIGVGNGTSSGRMKYVKDDKLRDAFEVWMRMRNQRYDRLKLVAYGITALTLAYFAFIARRTRSLWIAQCLAQIFIILMSQLTCYYYSFMILLAPLTKVRRQLEVPLFGLATLSQFAAMSFYFYDDRYWVLTALCLGASYVAMFMLTSRADRDRIARLLGRGARGEAHPEMRGAS